MTTPEAPSSSPPGGPRPEAPTPGWSYERTLKDPLTEESIDLILHRPIAYAVLLPWQHASWRPTPNHFTLMGGVLGLLGAAVVMIAPDGSLLWVVAAFLMFAAHILDCCDGMLARLTRQGSSRGMLLDGMIDFIVGVAFWLAMSLRTAPDWGIWTVPAALSIILSILIHTGLHDQLRLRFELLVNPPAEPRAVATPPQPGPASPPERRGLWTRFLDAFFGFAQRFYEVTYINISRICVGVEPGSPRPAIDPDVARQMFAGPMGMANYLGLSTHMFLMYAVTSLALYELHLPFVLALTTVVVGLNLWAVLVVIAWRRAEGLVTMMMTSRG
ncbi:MAG: CDP-alcohol phosphatidyltransferase family protein [Nannocystis sp.]|nr:CDP-alcohol phosphatidyltransferase family protein [Nannocystis sp.]MBA3546049.1 CDP-alcohol phosphatidyltransferase family protein [Nannocystis sp.]